MGCGCSSRRTSSGETEMLNVAGSSTRRRRHRGTIRRGRSQGAEPKAKTESQQQSARNPSSSDDTVGTSSTDDINPVHRPEDVDPPKINPLSAEVEPCCSDDEKNHHNSTTIDDVHPRCEASDDMLYAAITAPQSKWSSTSEYRRWSESDSTFAGASAVGETPPPHPLNPLALSASDPQHMFASGSAPHVAEDTANPCRFEVVVVNVPFHPHSRILPRHYNSLHDKYYRGDYRSKENPQVEILRPGERLAAQAEEQRTNTCLRASGMAWPALDPDTGEPIVLPMEAISDELATRQCNGIEGKSKRQHILRMVHTGVQRLTSMIEEYSGRLGNREESTIAIRSEAQRLRSLCGHAGFKKLEATLLAVSVIALDMDLLVAQPERFLSSVHMSAANHLEAEFAAAHPCDSSSHATSQPHEGDVFGFRLAALHEVADQLSTYLMSRFVVDVQYCLNVAMALIRHSA